MNNENIVVEIKNYLKSVDATVNVENDTDLEQSGLLSSLHMMGLVVLLENLIGSSISIDKIKVEHFRTIDTILANFFVVTDEPEEIA